MNRESSLISKSVRIKERDNKDNFSIFNNDSTVRVATS